MQKMRFRSLTTLTALLGWAAAGFAQPPADRESPRQRVMGNFEQKSPKVGQPLPDISAYDAEGHEINLRSLKGNYVVLVFGCLT